MKLSNLFNIMCLAGLFAIWTSTPEGKLMQVSNYYQFWQLSFSVGVFISSGWIFRGEFE